MSRSRIAQFLKARSPLVTLVATTPLVVAVLSLTACVRHPVGDPEKSQVDPKLSGVWRYQDPNGVTLLFIRPYDARTYFVKSLSYGEENGVVRPSGQEEFKAWLTPLAGATFLTLEPLDCAPWLGLKSEEFPYFVGKVQFAENSLNLRIVNGGVPPAKGANNRAELEDVITKNVGADALYTDKAMVFIKFADKARIEAVLKAFRGEGGTGRKA